LRQRRTHVLPPFSRGRNPNGEAFSHIEVDIIRRTRNAGEVLALAQVEGVGMVLPAGIVQAQRGEGGGQVG
jgi:hypothetical protein